MIRYSLKKLFIFINNDDENNLIILYPDGDVILTSSLFSVCEFITDINIDINKLNDRAYAKCLYNKLKNENNRI